LHKDFAKIKSDDPVHFGFDQRQILT